MPAETAFSTLDEDLRKDERFERWFKKELSPMIKDVCSNSPVKNMKMLRSGQDACNQDPR